MSDVNVVYIILPNSIVFNFKSRSNFNSRSITVEKGTKMYDDVLLALKENRKNDIPNIIDKVTVIKERCKGTDMHIEGSNVYVDGEIVDAYIAKKLIEFSDAKLPFQPLVNFWRRLKKNPSENSRKQLYPFLEVCSCPLTEDGQIISLKAVEPTDDPKVFISKWDRKFKYVIGEPCREDRNIVEDNPDKACARGIHAGSLSYAKGYGGCSSVIIELLIDPEHVVSVPKDHHNEKLRACEVLPLAVYQGGNYNKGIAVESNAAEKVTEKVEVAPVTQSTVAVCGSTPTPVSGYLINNQAYIFNIIEISLFDNFSGNNPDVSLSDISEKVRFRASKAPAAVKRYANDHELSVYEAYRFMYNGLTYYVAVFAEEDDRKYCYVLSPVVEGVDTWSTIKEYLAGPVKEVEVEEERVNPLVAATLEVFGEVVYCNDTYEVGYLKDDFDVPTYVENDMAGFVRSLTTVKPSKMPIGLKNLMDRTLGDPRIVKFYRLVLNDDALCFIVKGFTKNRTPYITLMRRK